VEALEGLLALDGLILLLISFSPRSKDSLFSKVRNTEMDIGMITLLTFLSALLLTNGLLDLVPLKDGSGLIAGIGIIPGKGLTTLIGIFFLLVAMIALFLLLAREFLEGSTEIDGDRASGVAAADAAVSPALTTQSRIESGQGPTSASTTTSLELMLTPM
jgi:hypothetical protein